MANTLLPTMIVIAFLVVRSISGRGGARRVAAIATTALLMIPVWDKAGRLAELLPISSGFEQAVDQLRAGSVSLDRFISLRTEDALVHDDRSAVSTLSLMVTASRLNLRSGPSMTAKIICALPDGTLLLKRGRREGKWTPVEWQSHIGWVSSEWVTLASPDLIDTRLWRGRSYFTIHPTSLLSRPDAGGQLLHALPESSKLVREERIGYWVKVKSSESEGWTKAEDLRIATAAEAPDRYLLAAQMFFEDVLPEEDPFGKIIGYLIGVGFFVALARMQRTGKSLLESFAANRIPLMFAMNVACSAFYFEVRNRSQLLLMSDNERLVVAGVAVVFTTATWFLVDAVAAPSSITRQNREPWASRMGRRHGFASSYAPINIYVSPDRNQARHSGPRSRR